MSQFITVHEKINGTAVAINTDHIFTICTGVTGTTISLRSRNFVWCRETLDEILQMIEAVAVIRCKDCIKKPICTIYLETNDDYGYCSMAERRTE